MPYTPTYYYDGGGGGGGSTTPETEPAPAPKPETVAPGFGDPEVRPNFTATPMVYVRYYASLNSVKGGSMTITLYRQEDGGDALIPCSEADGGAVTYDGTTDTETTVLSGSLSTPSGAYGDDFYPARMIKLKLVYDYTYPDGTTGHEESSVFEAGIGNYLSDTFLAESEMADTGPYTFKIKTYADTSAVDISQLQPQMYYYNLYSTTASEPVDTANAIYYGKADSYSIDPEDESITFNYTIPEDSEAYSLIKSGEAKSIMFQGYCYSPLSSGSWIGWYGWGPMDIS